jgi:hypothetical protein
VRITSHLVVSVAFVGLAAFAVPLAACGGKIAPDGRSSSGGDPTASGATSSGSSTGVVFPPPAPSSSDQPSWPLTPSPSPSSPTGGLGQPGAMPTVDDACAAICERNAQCGADSPDCKDTCSSEIHGASACAAQANAYIQCYASNLASGCAELPPVCEGAYCAYTICAGKVVPDYCGSR